MCGWELTITPPHPSAALHGWDQAGSNRHQYYPPSSLWSGIGDIRLVGVSVLEDTLWM